MDTVGVFNRVQFVDTRASLLALRNAVVSCVAEDNIHSVDPYAIDGDTHLELQKKSIQTNSYRCCTNNYNKI